MGYPIFTGIFLDEESKDAVKQLFKTLSYLHIKEYDHFYCRHVTLNRRPDFKELLFSESEPAVECYLTHLVQDPYIQTFKVFVPFPHKKKHTHLTYAIADDEEHSRYGGNKRPIAKPFYSNHLLKHLKNVEQGRRDRNPEVIELTLSEPFLITGNIVTIMSNSSYRPHGTASRYT